MSIIICKHCGQRIDTDFNSEHEEECEEDTTMLDKAIGFSKKSLNFLNIKK